MSVTRTWSADDELVAVTAPAAARGSDFALLSRRVRAAGLLERRRGRYAVRIATTGVALVATWVGIAVLGNSWWQLLTAVLAGVMSTQVAFLGHDAAHQQMFSRRRSNALTALVVANLLSGLSLGWWSDKHNRHHANPNQEDQDPDIGEGVLAFTAGQAARRTGRLAVAFTRHQAWLFFPLLTLEAWNLHVSSARWLLTHRGRRAEKVLFAVHVVAYLGGVLAVMSPWTAIAFILVHQATFGLYMGCSFAPNHKGMPVIPPGQRLDYLRKQVLTSRNVKGGVLTDLLLGGLNYQIEHHLFPNMPRASLRRAQALVQDHCAALGIGYAESSLVGSYVQALRHLNNVTVT